MDSDRTIGCSQPPRALRGEVGRRSAVAEPDRSPLNRIISAVAAVDRSEIPMLRSRQGGYRSADHGLCGGRVWCVEACVRLAPGDGQKENSMDGGGTERADDPKMDRRGVEPVAGANRLGASHSASSWEQAKVQQPVAQLVRSATGSDGT